MKHGPNWQTKRVPLATKTLAHGYVMVFAPDHPRASTSGSVREHTLLAEAAMGKPMPPAAEIHHVDGCRSNNAPSNLVVCNDSAYHNLLHQRARALAACGNAAALRCVRCGKYDDQEDMTISRRGGAHPGIQASHRACNRAKYLASKMRDRQSGMDK